MLCARLLAPRHLEMAQVPSPEPNAGEVIVRVEACLTCGTDLKTFRRGHARWSFPMLLGHEVSGRIEQSRSPGWPEGAPVMLAPTAPCNACRPCLRGRTNLCETLMERMAHGGFAELYRVPAEVVATHLARRPDHVSAERAAFLEPLACVVHGASALSELRPDDTVLVMGCGTIGLLFVMLARCCNPARLLVSGRRAERLQLARELGADGVFDLAQGPLDEWLADQTGGAGADLVVECVGSPEAWREAQRHAGAGATVVLFGGCPPGSQASFDATRLHYGEQQLRGCFHYTPADVARARELLCQPGDGLPVERLLSGRHSLLDLPDLMARLDRRQGIKYAVSPAETGARW